MTVRRRIHLSALVAVAVAVAMGAVQAVAQPLVTGDLTIYYNFDNFTDVVTDGSGNGFNGKVRDATRKMTDEFERGELFTSGVISNDMSNPRRVRERFASCSRPSQERIRCFWTWTEV